MRKALRVKGPEVASAFRAWPEAEAPLLLWPAFPQRREVVQRFQRFQREQIVPAQNQVTVQL
ncbi:MAG TPA: hypothetical protein VGL72_03925 [Bryobacteraceae bacterium]